LHYEFYHAVLTIWRVALWSAGLRQGVITWVATDASKQAAA